MKNLKMKNKLIVRPRQHTLTHTTEKAPAEKIKQNKTNEKKCIKSKKS